jgi:hypothetical protein
MGTGKRGFFLSLVSYCQLDIIEGVLSDKCGLV